jgi:hypothetical protein
VLQEILVISAGSSSSTAAPFPPYIVCEMSLHMYLYILYDWDMLNFKKIAPKMLHILLEIDLLTK